MYTVSIDLSLAGKVMYPIQQAREMLRLYRELTAKASDELTAFASLITTPDGVPNEINRHESALIIE